MRKLLFILLIVFSGLQLHAQFEDLTFGTDSTLEIVSWNIEHFPKNGQQTVNYVTQIIEALDIDILAIQEVSSNPWLDQLTEQLDGYNSFYAYNKYIALAFIYKTNVIEDVDIFEIYTQKWREFPRSPLVMEMNYKNKPYVIINNHLKCCGDGLLDQNDNDDEEKRRLDACNLLDVYIEENHSGTRVVVLGDLNDILTDLPENNVFQAFTENPENYLIADKDIAEGGSSNWSYPSWPSHIDHIFISNEMVNDYLNYGSDIRTIRLDTYFNSWSNYDNNVSDHRPIGLKIKTDDNLGVNNFISLKQNLSNFPNPFKNYTTLDFNAVRTNAEIEIFNTKGQLMKQFDLPHNQTKVIWNTEGLPNGIYYAKLIIDSKTEAIRKMVLIK